MRRSYLVETIVTCLILVLSATTGRLFSATEKRELDTMEKKTSYSAGYDMGKNFIDVLKETDIEYFIKGLRDAVNGDPLLLGQEENREIIRLFKINIQDKRMKKQQELAEKNKSDGEKFMELNARNEGVIVTASGLQYSVIKEGTGTNPATSDTIRIHYNGMFLNGEEFDSSLKRGVPLSIKLERCIPGWKEGIPLMKVGGKYRFFIPSELAYGKSGFGSRIGPNCTLIFEVELLDIQQEN